jgi:hypothetical protein
MNQLTPTVRQMFAYINDGLNCDHASATYCMDDKGEWYIVRRPYLSFCETFRKYYCIPAFTLTDMLQLLPPSIGEYKLSIHDVDGKECVQYENPSTKLGRMYIYDDTRINAVYTAIQLLIADGVIETTKTFNYDERIVPLKRSTTR